MAFRVAEGKPSPKREFRSLRSSGRNHRSLRSNLLESIAQVKAGNVVSQADEDGVVRVKLLVKKQDVKQMLELMRGGKSSTHHPSYSPSPSSSSSSVLSLEQRLNLLRKKHLLRANMLKGSQQGSWSPALQSIPEEL